MLVTSAACTSNTAPSPSGVGNSNDDNTMASSDIGNGDEGEIDGEGEADWSPADGLVVTGSCELLYAKNFTIDFCIGGYNLISIFDGQKFLTIPEDSEIPAGLDEDIILIQMPLNNIMVSSTPTMSLINAIGGLDSVSMTTADVGSWYIENVIRKMEDGEIIYIGAYQTPDYEMLADLDPPFAIFSTMLNSVPDVAEKLDELGIPVLLDQATFEPHPLGRIEWMKLYAVLFNLEEAAEAAFNEQVKVVESLEIDDSIEKTVAIFYIISNGNFVVRNAGDYFVYMLELAGGTYINKDQKPDETGNTQMEGEAFFAGAYDADYIIYIHNLGGRPSDLEAFKALNPVLENFKAVTQGNVWCTTPDFFQVADTLGYMIKDINTMLTSDDTGLTELDYLFKLN